MTPESKPTLTPRVAHLLDGRHFGGAEQMVRYYVQTAPRTGHHAEAWCLTADRFTEILKQDGLPHQVFPVAGKFDFRVLGKLCRAVRERKIDLIQGHTSRTHLMARIVSRRTGIPNVTTIHSQIGLDENQQKRPRISPRAWVERFGRPWTDFIVCASPDEAKRVQAEEGVDPVKVRWISNGVPLRPVPDRSAARRELAAGLGDRYSVTEATLVLVMVAQMRPRKGPEVLLRAFARWQKPDRDGLLILIGDDSFTERPYLEELKTLASALGVADRVIFTGFMADPWTLAAGADLLVLPALYGEAVSLVMLEAMNHAIPVMISEIPGPHSVVKMAKNGWLHTPGDHTELAAQIAEAESNREKLFEMGSSGRKVFEERFTIDAISSQYQTLYHEILRQTR